MLTIELFKSFKHKYLGLDWGEFNELTNADPTITINERGNFCGKYAVWIANQYVKGNIKVGDTPELKAALTTYDKHKSHLKPIKEVKDLTELIDLVKGLSDDFKPSRCISKGEQGLEKVYEDDEWIVYIPHTFEASRKIGGDTKWCTAASNGQSKFDYYTNKGPLYVNVRKSDGNKYQFHFETNQFMNKFDNSIQLKWIKLTTSIKAFYKMIDPIFGLRLKFNILKKNKNGFYYIKDKNKYNWINSNCDLLSPTQWFDWCLDFCNKKSIVSLKGKLNYLNEDGTILLNDWLDDIKTYTGQTDLIKKDGKYNWINSNCGLLSPTQWFDYAEDFKDKNYAIVKLNKKYNIIDKKGNIISKQWLDCIYAIRFDENDYSLGNLDGCICAITINGEIFPIKNLIENYNNSKNLKDKR